MSREGFNMAVEAWVQKEAEACREGIWAEYDMCIWCCDSFRKGTWNTDADVSKHFGGELVALTFFERQRIRFRDAYRCDPCFNAAACTGDVHEPLLVPEEVADLKRFINNGGLMGIS